MGVKYIMYKVFITHYQVRIGREVKRDRALIFAKNKTEAKAKLIKFINNKANNILITSIFLIDEYHGTIFTNNFGYEIPTKEE